MKVKLLFLFLSSVLSSTIWDDPKALPVFVLSGQSNMVGFGTVGNPGSTEKGTLFEALSSDPLKFGRTWDKAKSSWKVLSKVLIFDVTLNKWGEMKPSYGKGDGYFGPEFGMAHQLNSHIPDGRKILILKAAEGGKSLYKDFRPPSSASLAKSNLDPYCTEASCQEVGPNYKDLSSKIKDLLDDPAQIYKKFPTTRGLTPKLNGFGWHQGFNDGLSYTKNQRSSYEKNLANLIKDLRADWQAPDMAICIGAMGAPGWSRSQADEIKYEHDLWDKGWLDMKPNQKNSFSTSVAVQPRTLGHTGVVVSQIAVADRSRHPDIGKVITKTTRQYLNPLTVNKDLGQSHHYWHNAPYFYDVGKTMADGFLALLDTPPKYVLATKDSCPSGYAPAYWEQSQVKGSKCLEPARELGLTSSDPDGTSFPHFCYFDFQSFLIRPSRVRTDDVLQKLICQSQSPSPSSPPSSPPSPPPSPPASPRPTPAPSCDAKRDAFPKTKCERDNTMAERVNRCKTRRKFFNKCAKTCCEAGVSTASTRFLSSSSDDGDGVEVSSSADLVPSTLLGIFVFLWSTIN
jgi:hypothetical protein